MRSANNEDLTVQPPDSLSKDLDWYIAHQQELVEKHNGKILVIVGQQLVKAFSSMADAYTFALDKYSPGTFTLQPCSPDPQSYTLTLYSLVYYSSH